MIFSVNDCCKIGDNITSKAWTKGKLDSIQDVEKQNVIIFGLCFHFSISQAKRTDFGHLNTKLETFISKTERFTYKTDVRKEFAVRSAINEDFSQILEKLDAMQDKLKTAKKALNQRLKSASKTLKKQSKLQIGHCIKALNQQIRL